MGYPSPAKDDELDKFLAMDDIAYNHAKAHFEAAYTLLEKGKNTKENKQQVTNTGKAFYSYVDNSSELNKTAKETIKYALENKINLIVEEADKNNPAPAHSSSAQLQPPAPAPALQSP
jgi:hypothetical protein